MRVRILALFLSVLFLTSSKPVWASKGRTSKQRVKKMVNLLKGNSSFPFRRIYSVKVLKDYEEAQAFAVGFHIFVSKKLLEDLDDGPLLAVVAHEMAHREHWHIFSRVGLFVGGSVAVALLRDYAQKTSYFKDFKDYMFDVQLSQEIQADCRAYEWLKELKSKGVAADPLDLGRALVKMSGINFANMNAKIFANDPSFVRWQKIQKGYPPGKCRNLK